MQWQAKSDLNTVLPNITDKITFIELRKVRRVILGNWLDTWISVTWYCKRYPFDNPDKSNLSTETRYKNLLLKSEDYYLENGKVVHRTSRGQWIVLQGLKKALHSSHCYSLPSWLKSVQTYTQKNFNSVFFNWFVNFINGNPVCFRIV